MDKEYNKEHISVFEDIQDFEILDFTALGGESIVFKGRKNSVRRTYALKFREKSTFEDFCDIELHTFEVLEKCSTGKIAGIIPDIPQGVFRKIYDMIPEYELEKRSEDRAVNPNAQYFCVIEDYIAGCDLSKYCRGDFKKGIAAHTPTQNASYEEVLAFQKKILNWIIQFSEIMINVTQKNRVLHLDIKPENIMILNETESLVLIDFGKSMEMKNGASNIMLNEEFDLEDFNEYYGTYGFAAPECCYSPKARANFNCGNLGIVDERSDIFSFGATLWECINPQTEIVIKETREGYFKRDLFNTPLGYSEELEQIIVKCTEEDPNNRFQSFEELKKAAKEAEKRLPVPDKASKNSIVFGVMALALSVVTVLLLLLSLRNNALAFETAKFQFDELSENYSDHRVADFASIATDLVESDKTNRESYMSILELACEDGKVTKEELETVLFKCLNYTDDESIMTVYINQVMANTTEKTVKTISESIALREAFKDVHECDGWIVASAVYNYKDDPCNAYKVVNDYADDSKYETAIKYLANQLVTSSNLVEEIAEKQQQNKNDIEDILNNIKEGGSG